MVAGEIPREKTGAIPMIKTMGIPMIKTGEIPTIKTGAINAIKFRAAASERAVTVFYPDPLRAAPTARGEPLV
jgi:hypothetical protein